MLGLGDVNSFSIGSFLLAILGAVIVLWLYRKFSSSRAV